MNTTKLLPCGECQTVRVTFLIPLSVSLLKMPPKKKKGKKEVHEHPEFPPSYLRRKANEEKTRMKKNKRLFKRLKKESKLRNRGKYFEDGDSGSEIEGEGTEPQKDTDLPQASGNDASASRSLEEDNPQKRYNKWGKKIKSKKPPLTSIKSKKDLKREESELQESATFSGNKAGTSRSLGQEGDLPRKKNKWCKKTGDDPTPLQEESSVKPKPRKGRDLEEKWLPEKGAFSSDIAGTSRSLGREVNLQQKKSQWSKKTGDDPTPLQEGSSVKPKSKKGTKGKESELQEDVNLPHSFCDKATTSSSLGQEVNLQQKKTKKDDKKKESSITPLQKQSSIKPESDVAISPKTIAEKKQLTSNIAETGKVYSRGGDLSWSNDKKLQEVQSQVKAEINKSADKETLKCSKTIEMKDNAQSASSRIHDEMIEDLTNNRNKFQQETEKAEPMLTFDPSILELKETAVIGDITVIATGRIGKRKGCTYSRYDERDNTIYIGDENVQISIVIYPGTQVVCKTRRCPGIDLVQNAQIHSGGFNGYATARPEQDIDADNAKSKSGFVSELPSQYCETEGDEATYLQDINTIKASEQHDEIATGTKSDLSSVGKSSNESDPSPREKLQKVQEEFVKSLETVNEKLVVSLENQVKANLSNI